MDSSPAPEKIPTPFLSWSTHEFERKDRHPDWLWTVGLVFGLGAVISFFYGNIFFGIFLCIGGVVTIVYALQKPKLLTITIEEKGISVNDGLIPYEKIEHFWLDETEKPDKLLLRVKGSFVPLISLPLESVTAEAIRIVLAPRIKEAELHEPTSVKLFDKLGF